MLQPHVLEVYPMSDYKLRLIFDTGEKKVFDVTPYIEGDWFGQLKDEKLFKNVHVSGKTIKWSGGQDIAPHELYDNSYTEVSK
jgi:hypothetical protein